MLRFLYLKQDFDESEIIGHLNENGELSAPLRYGRVEKVVENKDANHSISRDVCKGEHKSQLAIL